MRVGNKSSKRKLRLKKDILYHIGDDLKYNPQIRSKLKDLLCKLYNEEIEYIIGQNWIIMTSSPKSQKKSRLCK